EAGHGARRAEGRARAGDEREATRPRQRESDGVPRTARQLGEAAHLARSARVQDRAGAGEAGRPARRRLTASWAGRRLLVGLGLSALPRAALRRGSAGRIRGAALVAFEVVAALRTGLLVDGSHGGSRAHRLRILVPLRRRFRGSLQRALPVAPPGLRIGA